ncbi:unnamed protein product [Adineta steineri]|uniref:Peptidase S1 domain-containing protein n=1 Tax=Adineta steineri TaxID=433720 RepID=A0A814X4I1_9BILA|nr:unnamed protein product [Adineta steineri]CAF3517058.1 unnamed protein product [Adineta steineri]CAF4178443.1 unnamed protein product [Adineta steineri]
MNQSVYLLFILISSTIAAATSYSTVQTSTIAATTTKKYLSTTATTRKDLSTTPITKNDLHAITTQKDLSATAIIKNDLSTTKIQKDLSTTPITKNDLSTTATAQKDLSTTAITKNDLNTTAATQKNLNTTATTQKDLSTTAITETTSLTTHISEVSPIPLPTSLNDKLDYQIYQTRLLTDIAEENRVALKRLTIMMSHLLDNNTKTTTDYTINEEKQHIEPLQHVDNVTKPDEHKLHVSFGVDADPGQYPWAVALLGNDRDRCGGTLIDNQHVLTAAHCIGIRNTVIRLGSHKYDEGEVVKPSFYCVHYSYSSSNYYRNDLAIIRLAKPVPVLSPPKRISTIDICNSNNIKNATVSLNTADYWMVGWGLKHTGNASNELQHAQVALTDNSKCKGSSRYTDVCVQSRPNTSPTGSCSGDSGSGLFQHTKSTDHWCVLAVASSSNSRNCKEAQFSNYVQATSPDYTEWFKNVLDRNKAFDDLQKAQKCKTHTLAQQICLLASC